MPRLWRREEDEMMIFWEMLATPPAMIVLLTIAAGLVLALKRS